MDADEFLGRSVDDASRVIEIDDVLVPTIASGLSEEQSAEKICRLTSSFSVAASMTRSHSPKSSYFSAGLMRLSAAWRSSSLIRLRSHLPSHVAVDGRDPGLEAVGIDIVEPDVEAGERADMRDAAAHLPRADHADGADGVQFLRARGGGSLFDVDHVRVCALCIFSLILRRTRAGHHRSDPNFAVMVNGRVCPVRPPVPATPCRGRRPDHSRRPGRSAPLRPC